MKIKNPQIKREKPLPEHSGPSLKLPEGCYAITKTIGDITVSYSAPTSQGVFDLMNANAERVAQTRDRELSGQA